MNLHVHFLPIHMPHENNRGHTFNEPNFFKNEKVVRENRSQCGFLAHEGGVTPLFDVASMENEIEEWIYKLILDGL